MRIGSIGRELRTASAAPLNSPHTRQMNVLPTVACAPSLVNGYLLATGNSYQFRTGIEAPILPESPGREIRWLPHSFRPGDCQQREEDSVYRHI